jgi:predicted lipoprotein with Yx(FWY)xxD motif
MTFATRIGAAVLALVVAVAVQPAPAAAQGGGMAMQMPAGVQTHKTDDGKTILVDAKGMTLYTYARDSAGKSNCNGRCAQNWPALAAAADAEAMGEWTIVTRDDGSKMWAYKGMPLYTFVRDSNPGDMSGDGAAQGSWKVATP